MQGWGQIMKMMIMRMIMAVVSGYDGNTTSTNARLAASHSSLKVPKAAAHLSSLPQLLKM